MIFPERHCRHCGEQHSKASRPSLKRWALEELLNVVREMVCTETERYITVECYASKLLAKKHLVDQCFAKLNLEGLLGQARNIAPHDSSRDGFFGGDSAWIASSYEILKKV